MTEIDTRDLAPLYIQYMEVKKGLRKAGASKNLIQGLLGEKMIRTFCSRFHASERIVITTLTHMATLKVGQARRHVSIMAPGYSPSPRTPSPTEFIQNPDSFVPAYADNKIHCILCGELAFTSCAYMPKDENARAFIYFVCKMHFERYPNNQDDLQNIEIVCDAYGKGTLMKHEFWNNMDEYLKGEK